MSAESSSVVLIGWQTLLSFLYFILPIGGVSLNFYVLEEAPEDRSYRFETSSGIALFAMATCDSFCLVALFTQTLFHVCFRLLEIHERSAAASLFCKLDLYVLHTTSAFSVWCWLVLSILRYTPRYALVCLIFFTAIFELWIPFLVTYNPHFKSCSEAAGTNPTAAQAAHVFDISIGYVLPAFLRIVLDGIVLYHCYKPNVIEVPIQTRRFGISAPCGLPASENEGPGGFDQSNSSIRNHPVHSKKTSMIKRSLIISVLNLCCNLPSHVLRALWTIEAGERLLPERWLIVFEGRRRNTTIYETSTAPTRPCALLTTQQSNSVVTTPAPQTNKTIFYPEFV
ncbi:putative G-protein coupled receptor AH9.4 [Aphelenchoides fujianensis]|nr:putative G-protein coupled receptor AH9.4 [Aphelenchoides fujianensis]